MQPIVQSASAAASFFGWASAILDAKIHTTSRIRALDKFHGAEPGRRKPLSRCDQPLGNTRLADRRSIRGVPSGLGEAFCRKLRHFPITPRVDIRPEKAVAISSISAVDRPCCMTLPSCSVRMAFPCIRQRSRPGERVEHPSWCRAAGCRTFDPAQGEAAVAGQSCMPAAVAAGPPMRTRSGYGSKSQACRQPRANQPSDARPRSGSSPKPEAREVPIHRIQAPSGDRIRAARRAWESSTLRSNRPPSDHPPYSVSRGTSPRSPGSDRQPSPAQHL